MKKEVTTCPLYLAILSLSSYWLLSYFLLPAPSGEPTKAAAAADAAVEAAQVAADVAVLLLIADLPRTIKHPSTADVPIAKGRTIK